MSLSNAQRVETGFAALAIMVLLIGTASGSAMFLMFASCIVLLMQLTFRRRGSLDRGAYVATMVGGLTAIAIVTVMLVLR
jgi:hypothetical protein